VICEIVVQLRGVLERDRMPESPTPPRTEELSAEDVPYRFVRQQIVRFGGSLRADGPDDAAAGAPGADARLDAGVRTRVDEDASLDEDPVGLLEGIDHALVRNSSERPRKDHHVERRIRQSKRLRGSFAEFHIRNTQTLRLNAPARERTAVGVDGEHRGCVVRRAERKPPLAGADVGNAQAAEVEAVRAELDLGRRP